MLCFNHPEKYAVGICKSCQRGLCGDCATDLGHGLACKGKHEEQVATLEKIINQSAKIYAVTPRTRNAAPLFYGFMGVVLIGFGLIKGSGASDFSVILGAGFLAFSIYTYIYNKKAYASKA